MPPRFHWARLRASCHGTEDDAKVTQALLTVAGLGPEAASLVRRSQLESHYGGTVRILELAMERSRAVRDLLDRITQLPGANAAIAATVEARTDDEGVLYVRFDKQEASQGRLVLMQGEDCVQVRIKPEVYPATREASVAAFAEVFAP